MVIAPVAEEKGYKDRAGEIVYDWYASLGLGIAFGIRSSLCPLPSFASFLLLCRLDDTHSNHSLICVVSIPLSRV